MLMEAVTSERWAAPLDLQSAETIRLPVVKRLITAWSRQLSGDKTDRPLHYSCAGEIILRGNVMTHVLRISHMFLLLM